MAFGIIGVAVFLLLNKRQQAPPPPAWYNPNQVPQAPMQNSPAWLQWAQGIVQTFGAAAWLWAPGGPFYNINPKQVYDALPPQDLNQYNWQDPNSLPQGWV